MYSDDMHSMKSLHLINNVMPLIGKLWRREVELWGRGRGGQRFKLWLWIVKLMWLVSLLDLEETFGSQFNIAKLLHVTTYHVVYYNNNYSGEVSRDSWLTLVIIMSWIHWNYLKTVPPKRGSSYKHKQSTDHRHNTRTAKADTAQTLQ